MRSHRVTTCPDSAESFCCYIFLFTFIDKRSYIDIDIINIDIDIDYNIDIIVYYIDIDIINLGVFFVLVDVCIIARLKVKRHESLMYRDFISQ